MTKLYSPRYALRKSILAYAFPVTEDHFYELCLMVRLNVGDREMVRELADEMLLRGHTDPEILDLAIADDQNWETSQPILAALVSKLGFITAPNPAEELARIYIHKGLRSGQSPIQAVEALWGSGCIYTFLETDALEELLVSADISGSFPENDPQLEKQIMEWLAQTT